MKKKKPGNQFLKDKKFVNELIGGLLKAPAFVSKIASNLADKLSDEIQSDPEFKKKFLKISMADQSFKDRVTEKILDALE